MNRRIIGIYGGSGAGKSSVSGWFRQHGALVIDADQISREVSKKDSSTYKVLKEAFPDYFDTSGTLDRRRLGRRIFTDQKARKKVEDIVQPAMAARVSELIENAPEELIVFDCAVLLNPRFRDIPNEKWLIDAPREVRVQRIMNRDGLSRVAAEERIAAQSDEGWKDSADKIIRNVSSLKNLEVQLEHAISEKKKS